MSVILSVLTYNWKTKEQAFNIIALKKEYSKYQTVDVKDKKYI